jgi:hypothetical protein
MRQIVRSDSSGWLVCLVALFLLILTAKASPLPRQTGGSSDGPKPIDVGMVALIGVPERYDGRLVRTHGFLCIEFEGDALYLHGEDYRHGLTKNSLALRLSKSQREQFKSLSLKYVLIEGTLYAKGLEQTDKWSGAIGNITRLEAWPVDRGPTPHQ